MKLFASLDPKDRKLLIGCISVVVVLAVIIALFARQENRDDNPMPSTYLTGRHGARAAFEMLQANGYDVERWEHPLSELAERSDAQTVVIFAEPNPTSPEDFRAVEDIVARGGRVLLTGWMGGALAPDGNVKPSTQFSAACKLTPQGLDSLAGSGEVWMVPEAAWEASRPLDRVEYNCAGAPAVVEYASGKGEVIWWASSTPLENGSIQRAENLNLFLNVLGAPQRPSFLLGRVAARRSFLRLVLRARPGLVATGIGPRRNRTSGDLQLQPAARAGARSARAGESYAGRVS